MDDDCDEVNDEDYAPEATACGVGACATTGQAICVSGALEDTCEPLAPHPETCQDTIDNDCDGAVNENDAIDATTWFADTDGDGFGDAATALRSSRMRFREPLARAACSFSTFQRRIPRWKCRWVRAKASSWTRSTRSMTGRANWST